MKNEVDMKFVELFKGFLTVVVAPLDLAWLAHKMQNTRPNATLLVADMFRMSPLWMPEGRMKVFKVADTSLWPNLTLTLVADT